MTTVRSAVTLPVIRVALVGVATVLTWLILVAAGQHPAFPPAMLSALAMLPVNIATLLLLRQRLRREGRRLRDLIGFSAARLPRDLLWGLLWFMVLQTLFLAVIFLIMGLRYGSGLFEAFATIFVDDSAMRLSVPVTIVLAVITAITFAPLNAPAEELVYRGYAQTELARHRWPTALAIGLPALLFGAQHLFYAPTAAAMPVFGVAFVVWGIGAGLIVLRQRRLMPMIIAHLLVNLLTSLPLLLVPLLVT
ncbi:CPBP family intramembrane glutamic endopeptidase [Microlunatus speluncae]|uniref:CPBP family intramembrane glutamic endopeptidase n=1 Tax=Microlunatus speluncae TaxID=2594267 RepID=UPI00126655BA|nr:CPBP family intramembrane glutamic endopeptidase [Microlunatus speluncae]